MARQVERGVGNVRRGGGILLYRVLFRIKDWLSRCDNEQEVKWIESCIKRNVGMQRGVLLWLRGKLGKNGVHDCLLLREEIRGFVGLRICADRQDICTTRFIKSSDVHIKLKDAEVRVSWK